MLLVPCQTPTEPAGDEDSDDEDDKPPPESGDDWAIIPLADMLNHSLDGETEFSFSCKTRLFTVRASRAYKRGEQVCPGVHFGVEKVPSPRKGPQPLEPDSGQSKMEDFIHKQAARMDQSVCFRGPSSSRLWS